MCFIVTMTKKVKIGLMLFMRILGCLGEKYDLV